jgi:hypothetical protein
VTLPLGFVWKYLLTNVGFVVVNEIGVESDSVPPLEIPTSTDGADVDVLVKTASALTAWTTYPAGITLDGIP